MQARLRRRRHHHLPDGLLATTAIVIMVAVAMILKSVLGRQRVWWVANARDDGRVAANGSGNEENLNMKKSVEDFTRLAVTVMYSAAVMGAAESGVEVKRNGGGNGGAAAIREGATVSKDAMIRESAIILEDGATTREMKRGLRCPRTKRNCRRSVERWL